MSSLAGSGCGLGFGRRRAPFVPWSVPGCKLWWDPSLNATLAADPVIGAWTLAAGWTDMGGGLYSHAGAADNLSQACLTVGQTVRIRYTVSGTAGGTIQPLAGATAGAVRAADGSYDEILTCTTNTTLAFAGTGTASVSAIVVDGLSVTAAADQSGNANHLSQATATYQMWLDDPARGGVGRNGLPVLATAGGRFMQTPPIDLSGTTQAAIFAVFLDAMGAGAGTVLGGETAADSPVMGIGWSAGNSFMGWSDGTVAGWCLHQKVRVAAWAQWATLHDTTLATIVLQNKLRRNGADFGVGSTGGVLSSGFYSNKRYILGSYTLTATTSFIGRIAAGGLFSQIPSAGDLALIEAYMMTRWGLP